jgi:murein DD-endopeptidase MepM/ murein hydrolase activator NlpD
MIRNWTPFGRCERPWNNRVLRTLRVLALCALVLIGPQFLNAYPLIFELSVDDLLFRQLIADVAASYRLASRGDDPLPLSIFEYLVREGDDLHQIASRLNIPVESIASLNRMPHPESIQVGMELLLPNQPAVFVPEKPSSDLELLSYSGREEGDPLPQVAVVLRGERQLFRLELGGRYSAVERAFFYNVSFRFPLESGYISSYWGVRASPFTGRPSFHPGIDIAAPQGTNVLASRGGIVDNKGWDPILGNFVTIRHEGGFTSVYGHLSAVFPDIGTSVVQGAVIGLVGSTGLSTGPHLHFEIRTSNGSRDPLRYLPKEGS